MIGKKIFLILIIISIIVLPTVTAIDINKIENNKLKSYLVDPPEWASNYFYGIVGATNQNGQPEDHKGVTIGYCQNNFKGKFAGVISEKDEKNPEIFIGGKISGPFLFGIIGNISTEKYTGIVGIGFRNETHFYFRLMGILGPTFYITGIYKPIE